MCIFIHFVNKSSMFYIVFFVAWIEFLQSENKMRTVLL